MEAKSGSNGESNGKSGREKEIKEIVGEMERVKQTVGGKRGECERWRE